MSADFERLPDRSGPDDALECVGKIGGVSKCLGMSVERELTAPPRHASTCRPGRGVADLDTGRPRRLADPFGVASITKTFIAGNVDPHRSPVLVARNKHGGQPIVSDA